MAQKDTTLDDEIARLRGLDLAALQSRWRTMFGRRAPADLPKLARIPCPGSRHGCDARPVTTRYRATRLIDAPIEWSWQRDTLGSTLSHGGDRRLIKIKVEG